MGACVVMRGVYSDYSIDDERRNEKTIWNVRMHIIQICFEDVVTVH